MSKEFKPEDVLYEKAVKLMESAYEYWKEYKKYRNDTVVWLEDKYTKELVIYTHQYKDELKEFIKNL